MTTVIKGDSNINLDFSTGGRITGDFSNATVANRAAFQTSTTNGVTVVGLLTNGTGTTTSLQVNNASDLTAALAFGNLQASSSEVSLQSGIRNAGTYLPMTFYTGGSERMRVDTSGNVGIGTSSPSTYGAKLNVASAASTQATIFILNPGQGSAQIGFAASGSNLKLYNAYSDGTLANGKGIDIDQNGNVGIGTISNLASSKLDVRGRIRTGSGNSSGDAEVIWSNYASATNAWTMSVRQDVGGANNDLKFLRFDSSGAYQGVAMQLDTSGNLLVGTTSGADFKLRVNRSGNFGIATFTNSETSGLTYDQTQIIVGQAAGTGYMLARYYTSAGAVAQFAFRGDGQMFATATSIASISDARTKENVRESSDGLDTVLGLRAVRFDFKEGFSNNRKNQLGFIAQEVEAVFPDAVDVSGQFAEDESEYKTVAPGTLIPVLVKAIQEQQALIVQLQADVAELKGAA